MNGGIYMKKYIKFMCMVTAITLLSSVISIFPANSLEKVDCTREVIATFNFDNIGKTSGDAVTDYYSQDAEPLKYLCFGSTNYCMSDSGKAFIMNRSKYNSKQPIFNWSEDTYVDKNGNDLGIQPAINDIELVANIEGYQNIELSYDLAVVTKDGTDSQMMINTYNNDYIQMPEYRMFTVQSSNQMKTYKFSFASSWIEDKTSRYNELIFRLSNYENYVINNITITGIKYDTSEGRKYIYGDADSNQVIDINDVTILQKYIAGMDHSYFKDFNDPYYYFCDIDKNYELDINDITCIQKYIAGINDDLGRIGNSVPINDYQSEFIS